MDSSVYIILAMVIILAFIAYSKDQSEMVKAFRSGGWQFLYALPRIIPAFMIGGLVQVVVPKGLIVSWIGEGSGFKGILIASLVGPLTPGGPMTHFPILASFWYAGAAAGPIAAYVTSWSLLGINRFFIWEIPLLGVKFSTIRFFASIIFPPIVGLAVKFIYAKL